MLSHRQSAKSSEFYSEYLAWKSMKRRCYNVNCNDYKDYGMRGIRVSEEWINSFPTFLRDMGKKPSLGKCSLDRINSKKDYSKENCKWSTAKEQSNNRDYVKKIIFKGISKNLSEWAYYLEIRRTTLWMRIYKYNWGIEKALTRKVV